ncbi:hypothetical protein IFDJLNFL_5625 [Methylobacterium dankookense]|uniref:Uncharacterized protein n=1 Tax=Methylobacterium dankookense TaxID=560405 RepID=A0ABQ4RRP2_9HYPH|nr:hypothetical protein IFDJLNFL_5625 [Methylobacterium dankookense]
MGASPQEDARGIGERGRDAGEGGAQACESGDLAGVDRLLRPLRADEVAHHEVDARGLQARLAGERQRLGDREAEPVHAGIDVERRRQQPLRERRPFLDLGARAEDGAEVPPDEGRARPRRQAVQNVDHGLGQDGARRLALGEMGDEDGAAARPPQSGRDRGEAAAIGVCLEHGGARDARRLGAEATPVRDDRSEIDGEARAVACRRSGLPRWRRRDAQTSPPSGGQTIARVMISSNA